MKNEHLVPDLINDLITKYKTSKGNEKFMLEARLKAIADRITQVLPNK